METHGQWKRKPAQDYTFIQVLLSSATYHRNNVEFTDHVMIVIVKLCLCVGENEEIYLLGELKTKLLKTAAAFRQPLSFL